MTTSRAEPTDNEIRRVALDMFSAAGYDGTSVRAIAEGVGIKASSLYNHFSSKEAILWDMTASALAALYGQWRAAEAELSDPTPTERLAAFIRSQVSFHIDRYREAVIINAQLGRLSPDHFDRAVGLRKEYEDVLTRIVQSCVAAGGSVPDVRVTVFALLQMTTAIATWYQPDGPMSADAIVDHYIALALKLVAPA
jgi:AcrR family transcriptional regulator